MCSVNNGAVPAEVDETQNHMKPVDVLETLDLARYMRILQFSEELHLKICNWECCSVKR